MKQVALIMLKLPDERMAMQRRTEDAPISPGKLGFFGGHIEPGETPDAAIRRELQEETSIVVESLSITRQGQLNVAASEDPSATDTIIFLFTALIPDIDFAVYEGTGVEAYTAQQLLQKTDVGDTARYILQAMDTQRNPQTDMNIHTDRKS